jgi:hypothetical protein
MNTHKTTLINGTFTGQDAASVLLEMLSFKIRYHQLKLQRNQEWFGEDTEHAQKRIKELTEERSVLIQWLENIDPSQMLDIRCQVNISIPNPQEISMSEASGWSES